MEGAREIDKTSRVESTTHHGRGRIEQDQEKHLPQQVKEQARTQLALKINKQIEFDKLIDPSLSYQATPHLKEDILNEAYQQSGQHHLSSEKQ